jgi:K+-sensing histidine kinase KdpD
MTITLILYTTPELETQLAAEGVSFLSADSPEAIVAIHEKHPYSVLFIEGSDLNATTALLGKINSQLLATALPRLVLVDNPEASEVVLANGATDVLRRPLVIAELQARVRGFAQELPRALAGSMDLLIHDFNSPLGITEYSLNLLLEILSEDTADITELEQLTRNVLRSNMRLHAMLFDMLDYMRLLHGTYETQHHDFDLLALTDRITNEASKVAHENNISIAIDVDEDASAITAHGDEVLFGRALYAALDTAIKFCQPGTDIIIHPFSEDNRRYVQISDNGQPLGPKYQPEQLFEPALASHMREAGSRSMVGLSLPFCRAALRAMQGDVSVESMPQRTVLSLWLPA